MITMREIKILSFAKINLSIDVPGLLDSGMHQVDMIMPQLSFHDDVQRKFFPDQRGTRGDVEIRVKTNRYYPVSYTHLCSGCGRCNCRWKWDAADKNLKAGC